MNHWTSLLNGLERNTHAVEIRSELSTNCVEVVHEFSPCLDKLGYVLSTFRLPSALPCLCFMINSYWSNLETIVSMAHDTQERLINTCCRLASDWVHYISLVLKWRFVPDENVGAQYAGVFWRADYYQKCCGLPQPTGYIEFNNEVGTGCIRWGIDTWCPMTSEREGLVSPEQKWNARERK